MRSLVPPLCPAAGLLGGRTERLGAWEGGREARGFPVQLQFSPWREEA